MITNLQIRNFRGLRDVTLRDLRRVNLLVGGNDTGKTSVLEALILLLSDVRLVQKLPTAFRNNQSGERNNHNHNENDDSENFWPWLFFDRNYSNTISINAEVSGQQSVQIKTEQGPAGVYPGQNVLPTPTLSRYENNTRSTDLVIYERDRVNLIGNIPAKNFHVGCLSIRPSDPVQDAEKYNQIALESDGEKQFEQIMREVEPRLKRLRYAKLPRTSSPLVFVDLGLSRSVPATQMGQAFNRLLHIYAEILTSKINVLLIDEIENGIFSESLPLIWKGLFAVCQQQNVQIFATTHSRECVMAAHQAAEDRGQDELSVQRLQIVNATIEAVRLGKPHLEMAAEMGLEVRS